MSATSTEKHFGKSKLHCFHTWRVKWTSRVGLENRKMSAHHLCLIVCYTGALERCVTTLKNGCVADYISFDVCLLNRGREAKLNRSTIEDILGISCVLWYRPLAIWAERASERILNNCEIMIILKNVNDHKWSYRHHVWHKIVKRGSETVNTKFSFQSLYTCILDCLHATFSLEISLVLISAGAIANHDVTLE